MEKAREDKKNKDLIIAPPQKTKKDGATHMNNQNNRIKMVGQDITKIKFKDALFKLGHANAFPGQDEFQNNSCRTFLCFLLSTSLHSDLLQQNNEFTTSIKNLHDNITTS